MNDPHVFQLRMPELYHTPDIFQFCKYKKNSDQMFLFLKLNFLSDTQQNYSTNPKSGVKN